MRVRDGKGDRSRTVALDASAQAFLERWLERRKLLGLKGRQPLFWTISTGEGFGSRVTQLRPSSLTPSRSLGRD